MRQNYIFFSTYANIYDILGEKRGDFGEKQGYSTKK